MVLGFQEPTFLTSKYRPQWNTLMRFNLYEKRSNTFSKLNFALNSLCHTASNILESSCGALEIRFQKDVILPKPNLYTWCRVLCLLLPLGRSKALFYTSGSTIFNSALGSQRPQKITVIWTTLLEARLVFDECCTLNKTHQRGVM